MSGDEPATGTPRVAGAVLAGGAGRRFGRPKAMALVDGRPMAATVVSALRSGGCDPVILVGDDGSGIEELGVPVVVDAWPGHGPLGAVITALASFDHDVVVSACDLARLDGPTVASVRAALDAQPRAVLASVASDGRTFAALARWRVEALPVLEGLFAGGVRSLGRALDDVRHVEVRVDAARLVNVNTPGDVPDDPLGGPDGPPRRHSGR